MPEQENNEVVEHSDGTLDYFADRAEEVNEEFAPEASDAEEQEEVEDESEAEETAEAPEDKSDTFIRLLEKEEKQRARATELDSDRKQFEQEQAELKGELATFNKSKAGFAKDPLGFLRALGVTADGLQEIGQMIYYDTLGEDAPVEASQLKEKFKTRNEIAELREQLKQQDTAKAEAATEAQAQQHRENYQESLFEATDNVSDDFPLVQNFVEQYGDQRAVGVLYNYALQNAEAQNGEGNVLTPQEGLARLEQELGELTKLNAKTAPDETAKPTKKKRTLRNKQSTIQTPSKDYDNMSPEEVVEEARKRFTAKMYG